MTNATKLIFLFLLCVSLSYCTKDKIDPNYSGQAFAIKNGSSWKAKVRATTLDRYPNKVFFMFDAFDEFGYVHQSLNMGNVALLVDTNLLIENPLRDSTNVIFNTNPISSFFLLNQGDVLTDVYIVKENNNRWICIDGYDAGTKEIRGRFEVSFIHDTAWTNNSSLDSIIFLNGTFTGKIIQ